MKPIDFDAHYADYAEKWVRENMGKYKTIDEMEARLPEVYLRYLNQPAEWLGGKTPGEYFAQMTDPDALIRLLSDYVAEDVDVPDLLLERISDLGESSVAQLCAMAKDDSQPEPLRVTALNLLIEIGTKQPMELCLNLVDARRVHDDVADVAAELLGALGREAAPAMLERLESASDEAQATYLDLLCNFPGDERIYTYAMNQFLRSADLRALYASYLGKLGDERAVPALRQALTLSDINYLDYIEIRNAIERLTGEELGESRAFDGDPYYESLKHM